MRARYAAQERKRLQTLKSSKKLRGDVGEKERGSEGGGKGKDGKDVNEGVDENENENEEEEEEEEEMVIDPFRSKARNLKGVVEEVCAKMNHWSDGLDWVEWKIWEWWSV